MNELIEKISSYNIFNYLFPGVVFAYLVEVFTSHKLLQENIIVALFLYYFIGLIISRIGSLIIEPILKWSRFVSYVKYADYIAASKRDEVIVVLSEQNNMHRTIIAMVIATLGLVGYDIFMGLYPFLAKYGPLMGLVLLGLLFLFSYRKQTTYIKKRINLWMDRND